MHNPRSAGRVAQSSDAQLLAALVTRHRIGIVAASVVMVLAAAGGFYVIGELERARPDPSSIASISLENLTVSQLTTSGKAQRATISPDGKYVAYIEREADQYSLWISNPLPQARSRSCRQSAGRSSGNIDYARWRVRGFRSRLRALEDSIPGRRRKATARAGGQRNRLVAGRPAHGLPSSKLANESVLAFRRRQRGSSSTCCCDTPRSGRFLQCPQFSSCSQRTPAWSPGGGVLAVSALFANGPGLLFVDPATRAEQTVPIEGLEHGMDWMDEGTLVFSLLSTAGHHSFGRHRIRMAGSRV